MMIKNDFESWLKSSAGKFVVIYTKGHSTERMKNFLNVLRILFGLIAISCILVLLSGNFINIGQVIGKDLGMESIQEIVTKSPGLFNLLLWLSTLFSLLSLWIMKMLRSSRKHIAEFYYFWDRHIESGRKLLKENS
ncbi:hypothetical protein [Labilibaculum manganireducens]|uniref:hypothetical protein n=1 Tax=Labilibaculum manganireducens TaxID=1940525 RepID=UPI0029F52D6E|nr:hypothetical protein [Labilibaculum manganireducens]